MASVNRLAQTLSGLPRWLAARGPLLLRILRKAKLLPLLLPLLIYAGAELYLHRSALRVLEGVTAALPAGVQFSFEQLDTQVDGGVDIQGATLLLPGMSLPLKFQSLRLVSSNWRELSAVAKVQGLLPGAARVEFSLAERELARLAAASALPVDATLGVLGCFEPAASSAASESDGAALFTGSFEYRFDAQTEYLNARLQLSAQQRYLLGVDMDLDIGAPELRLSALDTLGIGGADLHFINLGAQSDLLRNCGATGRAGLVEGIYVARQSEQLKRRLSQQGWLASTELELAYQDYLFLPLQLSLQLTAVKAVSLLELTRSAVSWGEFGVRIGLNSPQADSQGLTWQAAAKRLPAASDAKMVQKTAAAEQTEPVKRARIGVALQDSAGAERQEPEPPAEQQGVKPARSPIGESTPPEQLPHYQPSYKPVSVRELSGLLGAPMRLTTLNGRQMEGVLERVEFDRLQLRSEITQGIAILPVRLDIISSIQVYF